MPQLNPEFFLSQLFWLVISFSFLLFFLWKFSLPRISAVLEKREIKINNDIQSAKKLQNEAEEIQNQIEKTLLTARNQTTEMIKKTSIDLQNKSIAELKKIDNELKKKIDESTKIIKKNKNNSMVELNDQIKEITKLTISKLSRISVNDHEINNAISKVQNKMVN